MEEYEQDWEEEHWVLEVVGVCEQEKMSSEYVQSRHEKEQAVAAYENLLRMN